MASSSRCWPRSCEPDPKADPVGYGQVRDALTSAIGDDVQTVFATAVRERANPRVNAAALDSIVQPEYHPPARGTPMNATCRPASPPSAPLTSRARQPGLAARRGRPGNAGRRVPEAGARQAQRLPAGKRGGRRRARPLFDHRHGARPDLALPRRAAPRSTATPAAAPHAFVPDDAPAAGQPARADRRDRGWTCRTACRRWPAGWSAIWATTWCGRWRRLPDEEPRRDRRAGSASCCAPRCSPSSTTSTTS